MPMLASSQNPCSGVKGLARLDRDDPRERDHRLDNVAAVSPPNRLEPGGAAMAGH